jgi:hypothetical protein
VRVFNSLGASALAESIKTTPETSCALSPPSGLGEAAAIRKSFERKDSRVRPQQKQTSLRQRLPIVGCLRWLLATAPCRLIEENLSAILRCGNSWK